MALDSTCTLPQDGHTALVTLHIVTVTRLDTFPFDPHKLGNYGIFNQREVGN